MDAGGAAGPVALLLLDLRGAVPFGAPHLEGVVAGGKGPVVPPDDPRGLRQRRPELGVLPGPAVHPHLHSGYFLGPGEGNAAHRHQALSVRLHHVAHCHGVNDRRGLHPGHLVPATLYPVALPVLGGDFNVHNPLGLLHPVTVGQPDAQGETVVEGQRLAVPGVAQHDPFIRCNQVQGHRLVEAVGGLDDQVLRLRQGLRVRQHRLHRRSGPVRCADQGGADTPGNTGQGHVLFPGGVVVPDLLNGQFPGVRHQPVDRQHPVGNVYKGGFGAQKHLVMVLHRRVLRPGARGRRQGVAVVGQGTARRHFTGRHGVGHRLGYARPLPLGQGRAQTGAGHGNGGRGGAQPDQELPPVNDADRPHFLISLAHSSLRRQDQLAAEVAQGQAPDQEQDHQDDEGNHRVHGGLPHGQAYYSQRQPEYQAHHQARHGLGD